MVRVRSQGNLEYGILSVTLLTSLDGRRLKMRPPRDKTMPKRPPHDYGDGTRRSKETVFRLWTHVAWKESLLKVSKLYRSDQPPPQVYLRLADHYGCLARRYDRTGRTKIAKILDERAAKYFRLGGGFEPPPAAMAMSVPKSPSFIRAVGRKER